MRPTNRGRVNKKVTMRKLIRLDSNKTNNTFDKCLPVAREIWAQLPQYKGGVPELFAELINVTENVESEMEYRVFLALTLIETAPFEIDDIDIFGLLGIGVERVADSDGVAAYRTFWLPTQRK